MRRICIDCGAPLDSLVGGLCDECAHLAELIYPGGAAERVRALGIEVQR